MGGFSGCGDGDVAGDGDAGGDAGGEGGGEVDVEGCGDLGEGVGEELAWPSEVMASSMNAR